MPEEPSLNQHPVAGVEGRDGAIVVRLAGELDLYNAPELREALFEACAGEPERVVVDLAEVSFIDSTALGVLVEARSRLAERRSFLLAAAGDVPRRALDVSGLGRHLSLHPSVDAALEADL